MIKKSKYRFSTLKLLHILTLAPIATTCVYAAQQEASSPAALDVSPHRILLTEDAHNDRVLRSTLNRNKFIQEHYSLHYAQTRPIYDIKEASRTRLSELHAHHMHRWADADVVTLPPAENKSAIKSILYMPVAATGAVLYSPIYAAKGIYNNWPSWLSRSKPADVATGTEPTVSAPPTVLPPETSAASAQASATNIPSISISQDAAADGKAVATSAPAAVSAESVVISGSTSSPKIIEEYGKLRTRGRKGQTVILAGDGGGERGYIEALEIEYLEKITNRQINQIADYIGGTSIFVMMGIGLSIDGPQGKPWSGSDLVQLFRTHSPSIFPKASRWDVPARIWSSLESLKYSRYSSEPWKQLLIEKLGQAKLGSSHTNIVALAIKSHTNTPMIITNSSHPDALAWETILGASAAPTYFDAVQLTSFPEQPVVVDAGLYANNPAFETLLQAKVDVKRSGQPFKPIVLSLGTGEAPVTPIPASAGVINGVGPIIDSCISTNIAATHHTLQTLLKEGESYFRLQPKLAQSIPLDVFDGYQAMMEEAAQSQFDKLDKFYEVIRPTLEAD